MPSEFTENVIAVFRANQGRVGGVLVGIPIIVIHHIGAKTRTEQVTPLASSSRADGRLVIAASNGGSPTHPAWYRNLKAHPTIEVEVGSDTLTVLAEQVEGAAHAELWPKLGDRNSSAATSRPGLPACRVMCRPINPEAARRGEVPVHAA